MNGRRPPLPDDKDRQSLLDFWHVHEKHRETLNDRTRELAMRIPDFVPVIKGMSPQQAAETERLSRENEAKAIRDNDWGPYIRTLREQGKAYAHMGIGFSAWFELTTAYREELIKLIEDEHAGDRALTKSAIAGLNRWIDFALALLGEAYLEAKETIISRQQSAIRELSTPVLTLKERLLILPVVGMVDSDRARQLTEEMLKAIRDRRARVVVMDVTGVPIVDSKVANHLVQSVEAARLMGAEVIMTGISPEIAQTLVTIGADLGDIPTLGDLQSGFEAANRILARPALEV